MKSVFADTLYWVAIVRPDDQWREAALRARKELGPVRLVTTDEVLSEFLTGLSRAGEILRSQAVKMVRAIMADPNVTVLPQSRPSSSTASVCMNVGQTRPTASSIARRWNPCAPEVSRRSCPTTATSRKKASAS
jgi:hypothetical protein